MQTGREDTVAERESIQTPTATHGQPHTQKSSIFTKYSPKLIKQILELLGDESVSVLLIVIFNFIVCFINLKIEEVHNSIV